MEADAFSEVLRAVRLTAAIFFRVDVRGEWVAETPPSAACAPFVLPRAQHVIEYHVIAEGSCWAGPLGVEPVRVEAGDVIAFPQGDAHVLASRPGLRDASDYTDFYRNAGQARTPFTVSIGEGNQVSGRIVCGFLGCDARPFNPLLGALPRMLHLRRGDGGDGPWLERFLEAALVESGQQRMGRDSMLTRLSELMFAELIRRHAEALPPGGTGWFAGLRDPHVGRALNLLHARPAEPWTLEALAREVALSRSSLAERFTRLVGQPPVQYLAQWRMQLAAGRLAEGGRVGQVALEVGYDSEAAFIRAFSRLVGMPPGAWRRSREAAPAVRS